MRELDGIGFRLPPAQKQALQRIGDARGMALSAVTREAIRWYLNAVSINSSAATLKEDAATETRGSPWASVD